MVLRLKPFLCLEGMRAASPLRSSTTIVVEHFALQVSDAGAFAHSHLFALSATTEVVSLLVPRRLVQVPWNCLLGLGEDIWLS